MSQTDFGSNDFQVATGVSRETLERLKAYCSLLEEWQQRFNLIGRGTVDAIWHRHFLDSAQLRKIYGPRCTRLVDLGSGAGFPGMVLAIMGQTGVELIEGNGKKCLFLERVSMSTRTKVEITKARFDEVRRPNQADVVTARAVAPLHKLLRDVRRWVKPEGVALLQRGSRFESELAEAARLWEFEVVRHPSVTNPTGAILAISQIRQVNV